jgi:hypothetical protein
MPAPMGMPEVQSRDFCSMMERADRVYRKEDIEDAGAVNAGFGPNGSATYDILVCIRVGRSASTTGCAKLI